MKTCSRCHTVRPLEQFKAGTTHCIWCPYPEPYADNLERVAPVKTLVDAAKDTTHVHSGELPADVVEKPAHYTFSKVEVIDAIEAWALDFKCANVVKYVARAKHKGRELEDLRKAAWYLARAIKQLESEQADTLDGGSK